MNMKKLMKEQERFADFVVIGGGMAGVSAAVSAARRGVKTILVQDRPVLGGNASKEIRVWLHGANGNPNNGYFRETGLMEELKLENLYRNPHGNAESWHLTLHNAVMKEPNLEVFLNTVITEIETEPDRITSVKGFTLASETWTTFYAPYFADTTGDGTIGYLAGVPYRTGQESRDEFGEKLARDTYEPYTMGGTIMFLAKDAGRPVPFEKPDWAHHFEEKDLEHRHHSHKESGIFFWWMEWGGSKDSIHDNEDVKMELWKIVYGMWDHLKNGPEHREFTERLELEWVGTLPGKRESRRLEGAYLLTEHDILNQTDFWDAVAYGGWNLDHHPSKGFFDKEKTPSFHYIIPGIYNIPLRSLYAKTCRNLFFAGRNISATHVAMCSTRVMLTSAQMGEAVGTAAVECLSTGRLPSELSPVDVLRIQQNLLKNDHYIISVPNSDELDLAREATVSASSCHPVDVDLSDAVETVSLDGKGYTVMFPVQNGELEQVCVLLSGGGTLKATLWQGDDKGNYIPRHKLASWTLECLADEAVKTGNYLTLDCGLDELKPGWYFLELSGVGIRLHVSSHVLTGVRLLKPWMDNASMKNEYSNWTMTDGRKSPCIKIFPEQQVYTADQTVNGIARPYYQPNLWISGRTDFLDPEQLILQWESLQRISEIRLSFDTNLDVQIQNMWLEYDFNTFPNCVRSYRLEARVEGIWEELADIKGNYQRHRIHRFNAVAADQLRLSVSETWGVPYASIYEIRVYGPE